MIEESDGKPKVGRSARKLGVRSGMPRPRDVDADDPLDPVIPGAGGMSVAPGDPAVLPWARRPLSLGGVGKDPVWELDTVELGSDLALRQDSPHHGLIEPARPMTLQEFEDALARTRDFWQLHCR